MKILQNLQIYLRDRKGENKGKNGDGIDLDHQALIPGTTAPDFTLPSVFGEDVNLSDYRGQPVILAFYPADGTPVCSNQMALYNEALPIFEEHGAKLLAISVDDLDSHRKFANDLNLNFPLLSDHEPKGGAGQKYGVFNDKSGQNHRALFVLDGEGKVRWSHVVPGRVNPGAHGILHALDNLGRSREENDG